MEALERRTAQSAASRSCPISTSPHSSIWCCSATRASVVHSAALMRDFVSASARTSDLHVPEIVSSAAISLGRTYAHHRVSNDVEHSRYARDFFACVCADLCACVCVCA